MLKRHTETGQAVCPVCGAVPDLSRTPARWVVHQATAHRRARIQAIGWTDECVTFYAQGGPVQSQGEVSAPPPKFTRVDTTLRETALVET